MKVRRVVVAAAIGCVLPAGVLAASLSRQLGDAFLKVQLGNTVVDPALSVVPALQRLVVLGSDFPPTSTTPGATFEYNPQLGVFERSASLGPVFVERADTVGANRFQLGFSFLYGNLDQIDGGSFGDNTGGFANAQAIDPASGELLGEADIVSQISSFELRNWVFNFSATYGITDNWDVNILLPLKYTRLETRVLSRAVGFDQDGEFDVFRDASVDDDAFGVGDLLLRTKYRFPVDLPVSLAGLLALRVPTGDEDDFQGLGDVTLTPLLIASRLFWGHDFHANAGVEINASSLQRSQFIYAVGATFKLIEELAFNLDLAGRASIMDEIVDIDSGVAFPVLPGVFSESVDAQRNTSEIRIEQLSSLVLATGFKWAMGEYVVGFAGVLIPLVDKGLTADVMPNAGFEVAF